MMNDSSSRFSNRGDRSGANCPRCGADNRCAMKAGDKPADCWCMSSPRGITIPEPSQRCYCNACLTAIAAEQDPESDR